MEDIKSIKKNFIITSGLAESWIKSDQYNIYFLTEACRLYSKKNEWQHLNGKVLKYHWNDRQKLKKDHDYLKEFYEKVLSTLTDTLNGIHKISRDIEYWRIVLGPWLITYMPIVFDRWEMLKIAYAEEVNFDTVELTGNWKLNPASNFDAFINNMQSDIWNYEIYLRIIKDQYKAQTNFLEYEANLNQESNKTEFIYQKTFKYKFLKFADHLLGILPFSNKILFYQSYFSLKRLIQLNFSLGQMPRAYLDCFQFDHYSKIDRNTRSTAINTDSNNSFEKHLFNNILKDIPISYLESFKANDNYANNIKLNPEIIFTANAYWGDDIFKFWLALQKGKGKKIILSHHGGSIPPLFDTFDHDEYISDKFVTWFKPYHKKHVQLPPNKISLNKTRNKGVYCSVIGFESPRYGYRATAGPITNRTLDCFNQTIEFCEHLSPEINSKLKIRPYPNMGWDTKLRFIDILGASKVETDISYKSYIENSKVIICTYPQTTFSEAMASGKPVMLVYIPEINEPIEAAKELIQILIDAKIAFSNPIEAANHLNKNWDTIEDWWSSESVKKARKIFFDIALRVNDNWKDQWIAFFKSLS